MIAAAIGLSLTAAAVHGTWNVLVKTAGDPIATFWRATLAGAVIASAVALPAWLVLGRPHLNPSAAAWCTLSATLETAYLWLLSAAYRRGELSAVYPIARGSAPVLAVIVGIVVLGERLEPIQLAGVGLLLLGILTVSLSQASGRATVPALLTGVAIAGYTSVDRIGVRLTEPWLYAWLLVVLIAVELSASRWVASVVWRAPAPVPGAGWRASALIGALLWGGYALVLWALSLAPLAIVAPVRELGIVGVAVWGVLKLGEHRRVPMKLSGAITTVVGIALLAT